MFFWNKKKEETITEPKQATTMDIVQLKQQAEALLANLPEASGTERIDCLNQLGSVYRAMQDTDAAIQYYELSLQENRVFGKACTELMALYNIKRKAAAMEKDDAKIQFYLSKLDELMVLNKSIMRANIS